MFLHRNMYYVITSEVANRSNVEVPCFWSLLLAPFSSHLLYVVHSYQHSISSLIEDGKLFSQFLLVVHGTKNTVIHTHST